MYTQTDTPPRTTLTPRAPLAPVSPLPRPVSGRLPGLESVSPWGRQDVWLQEALLGPYSEDILEYLDLARRTGGPVLDLGSGAGRLAVPFARYGIQVNAVDQDARSLERLRAWALRIRPGVRRFIRTTRADLGHLRLDCSYQLALLAGAMVSAVPPDARPGMLREVATHLGDGGALALDFTAHEPSGLARHPDRAWRFPVPRFDGVKERAVARQVFDLERMTEHVTYWTERSGNTARRRSTATTLKWLVDQDELRSEVEAAGLRVTECRQHRLDRRTLSVLLVCRTGK